MDQAIETSLDAFLNGQVQIRQPLKGYRAGNDAVLLAAACPARRGQRVLDVGSGVGTASFCLGRRVEGLELHGLEVNPPLSALSVENAALNQQKWLAHTGNVTAPPEALNQLDFAQIVSNPPYFATDAHSPSPQIERDRALRESAALSDWLGFCCRRLQPKGTLTLVHRMERLPQIFAVLETASVGGIRVLPLQSQQQKAANRFLLCAKKDSRAAFSLLPPLTLHQQDGTSASAAYTSFVQGILREGRGLDLYADPVPWALKGG